MSFSPNEIFFNELIDKEFSFEFIQKKEDVDSVQDSLLESPLVFNTESENQPKDSSFQIILSQLEQSSSQQNESEVILSLSFSFQESPSQEFLSLENENNLNIIPIELYLVYDGGQDVQTLTSNKSEIPIQEQIRDNYTCCQNNNQQQSTATSSNSNSSIHSKQEIIATIPLGFIIEEINLFQLTIDIDQEKDFVNFQQESQQAEIITLQQHFE